MKILFSARPAYGHMYPLMPLALAASDAGHEVSFATCEPFRSKLTRLGFTTHESGISFAEGVRELMGDNGGPVPVGADGRPDVAFGAKLFAGVLARHAAHDLVPVLERMRPDLVVYEQGELGAPVAAYAAGVPVACHAISPSQAAGVVEACAAEIPSLWREFGEPEPRIEIFGGDVYIDPVPASLDPTGYRSGAHHMPIRPVPWSEPGAGVPAWVGRGHRPLVYLTLGSVVGTGERLRPAIEGLAALDADVLVALGSAAGDELGALPANVHVHDFIDQARLLRDADLVVHHGGSGTLLGALTHAVPQLVLPKGADQFSNADLLTAAELGTVLEPGDATAGNIRMAATDALSRPVAPGVLSAQREIAAMPDPRDVVAQLASPVPSI